MGLREFEKKVRGKFSLFEIPKTPKSIIYILYICPIGAHILYLNSGCSQFECPKIQTLPDAKPKKVSKNFEKSLTKKIYKIKSIDGENKSIVFSVFEPDNVLLFLYYI